MKRAFKDKALQATVDSWCKIQVLAFLNNERSQVFNIMAVIGLDTGWSRDLFFTSAIATQDPGFPGRR
ncbi:MAG: hypothetical protein JRC68_03520 [Deltaproteobacteria bacterium]|nr:hypothetical protein [Deltaproteobacteria bacterium]